MNCLTLVLFYCILSRPRSLYSYSTSQFGSGSFQMLTSHTWPVAALLVGAALQGHKTATRELFVLSSGDHSRILSSKSCSFFPARMSPSAPSVLAKEDLFVLHMSGIIRVLVYSMAHNPSRLTLLSTVLSKWGPPTMNTQTDSLLGHLRVYLRNVS